MRIRYLLFAAVLFRIALPLCTNINAQVLAQETRPLPPQIDSRSHFVVWADIDRVTMDELRSWMSQTELSPFVESPVMEDNQFPDQFLRKLRAAGAKRVYATGDASALMGNLSAIGLVIRCDRPRECAAALSANPILPGQVLTSIEDGVLLAMSPEGLEKLVEIEGAPSEKLITAVAETQQETLGVAASIPAAVVSLFFSSAPRDGGAGDAAIRTLTKLQWARVTATPPNSKLKVDAVFDTSERAAEFAQQINSLVGSLVGSGKETRLLIASNDRVTFSSESVKPVAAMIESAREAARRQQSMNNLRQLIMAQFNFVSSTGAFSPQALTNSSGKRLLSWRVLILPYIEQEELYNQFHLDEAWDSPHNLQLLEKMPAAFGGDPRGVKPGYTQIVAPLTKNSIMGHTGGPTRMQDISDGTSNTIMLMEVPPAAAVPWTKPEDFVVDTEKPMAGMTTDGQQSLLLAFADGSVRALSTKTDPKAFWALLSRDGGEVIPDDALEETR